MIVVWIINNQRYFMAGWRFTNTAEPIWPINQSILIIHYSWLLADDTVVQKHSGHQSGVRLFQLCLSKLASNSPAFSGCRPAHQPTKAPPPWRRILETDGRTRQSLSMWLYLAAGDTLGEDVVSFRRLVHGYTANGARVRILNPVWVAAEK